VEGALGGITFCTALYVADHSSELQPSSRLSLRVSKQVAQSKFPLASGWALWLSSGSINSVNRAASGLRGGSSPRASSFGSSCRVSLAMSSAAAAMVV